jgi:hypothetical protein
MKMSINFAIQQSVTNSPIFEINWSIINNINNNNSLKNGSSFSCTIEPYPSESIYCAIAPRDNALLVRESRSFLLANPKMGTEFVTIGFFKDIKAYLRKGNITYDLKTKYDFKCDRLRINLPKLSILKKLVKADWHFYLKDSNQSWSCDQLRLVKEIPLFELPQLHKMKIDFLINPVTSPDTQISYSSDYQVIKTQKL